jgi:hypothetical protein
MSVQLAGKRRLSLWAVLILTGLAAVIGFGGPIFARHIWPPIVARIAYCGPKVVVVDAINPTGDAAIVIATVAVGGRIIATVEVISPADSSGYSGIERLPRARPAGPCQITDLQAYKQGRHGGLNPVFVEKG